MSSTVATVNVVRAHDHPGKFLRQEIQLVGGFRATEHAESLGAEFLHRAAKADSDTVKGFFPARGPQLAMITN
jgi:hypothetical protein